MAVIAVVEETRAGLFVDALLLFVCLIEARAARVAAQGLFGIDSVGDDNTAATAAGSLSFFPLAKPKRSCLNLTESRTCSFIFG